MTTTFISYRREDDVHCAKVRDLADRLERAGISITLDEFAQAREFHGGGPNEGWPRWCKNQASKPGQKVLVVASPGWFRCYQGTELPGIGLGAAAEASVIEQRLYNSAGVSAEIRLVTTSRLDPTVFPLDLQRYHRFTDPESFGDLVAWITGTTPAIAAPLPVADWPETPPPLVWPIANHRGVRVAFEQLVTRMAPWRFLPLRGPTEAGKSHVTRQILGNALRLAGLACGRFDFKGTTAVNSELHAFVQNLDVPLPPAGPSLVERLGQILDTLNGRGRPALLIFDTYEAASGEAQDWIEKHLLPRLSRASWLRVVIAGQRVPNATGAPWSFVASPPIQLAPPPPEDWFTFGQEHRPALTLDFVRQAHEHSGGKPSLLAQLLGPKM